VLVEIGFVMFLCFDSVMKLFETTSAIFLVICTQLRNWI
jgi:hypothetical protein